MKTQNFGTIAWQEKMLKQIDKKLESEIALDANEAIFLAVQAEHNSRLISKLKRR
jgi:hypothetical protein